DRDSRALDGRRPERHRSEAVVLAAVLERLARPEPLDDPQRLVEDRRPLAGIGDLADVAEAAVVEGTQADGHDEASAGEMIDRDRLAGQLPRPPARGREDDGAERDPRRPDR